MSIWQTTCTSPANAGSLFVLPMESAERADEQRGHNQVRWDR